MYVTFPDVLFAHKWCWFAFILASLAENSHMKESTTKSKELQLLCLHQNVAQQIDWEK